MRFGFIAIIAVLLLADVLAWWLASRWLRSYAPSKAIAWTAHSFFGIQASYVAALAALALLGPANTRHIMDWIPTWAQALIYIWHLVFLPAALLLWLVVGSAVTGTRLVRLVAASRKSPASSRGEPEAPVNGITRRNLLLASVAAIPPLMAVGATGYSLSGSWTFRLSRMRLAVAGLPPALEGFRIAHVSDLHVGRWSTRSFLDDVVETTNSLNADVVLFTGDLIDISIRDLPQAIEAAKRLRGKQGLVLIEGNHDLIDDSIGFRRGVTHEGMNFLRGRSAMLEYHGVPIEIMGLPWARSEAQMRQDVLALAGARDSGAFPILLAHHPHAFDAAAEAGLPLTLSGHTHGGQLALNREINAGNMLFRYVSGLYHHGSSKLLVSNGTGNWFPLRLGAPAEIIEITLARA